MDSDRGVAAYDSDVAAKCIVYGIVDRDGGLAQSGQYEGSPAIPVNKQHKVLAGPTSMTRDFAPKCASYCSPHPITHTLTPTIVITIITTRSLTHSLTHSLIITHSFTIIITHAFITSSSLTP
eukprot:2847835-Pyramimonas_sp.AAC.1